MHSEVQTSVLLLGPKDPFWTELLRGLRAQPHLEVHCSVGPAPPPTQALPVAPNVMLAEPEPVYLQAAAHREQWGQHGSPRILLLCDEPATGASGYPHEVHGVLSKKRSVREIVAAIRIVAGGYWLSAVETKRCADGGVGVDPESIKSLSDRELDVLRLIAGGYSNARISRELFLSTSTVKSHIQRLFGKLGIKNRTQAVIYAYESGVVGQSTSAASPFSSR